MSKISKSFRIDGVLTNITSAVLSDPTGTYGVKRNDNDAVVVADGTAMTNAATGVYTHEFTDPADDLTYTYYIEWVYDGETHHTEFTLTGPVSTATCPLTLAEVKLHLKVEHSDDDTLIAQLMLAATAFAEQYQKRTYINRTRYLYFDVFPISNIIYVPHPPLSSVTSIKYLDTDGNEQTLSASVYRVDTKSEPGRITLEYDQSWPDYRQIINTITITYVAGYGASSDVPDDVKAAIKLIVGHLYEHREAVSEIGLHEVPLAAKSLLGHERILLPCR